MTRAIDYYFTLGSPWAYLGHERFLDICRNRGASVVWRPFPVRQVFDETGGLPLPRRHPVRQRYRLVELQRWREKRGLALNLRPKHGTADVTLANRCVIALEAAAKDPDPFVRAGFAAFWVDDQDLADPAVIEDRLLASGHSHPGSVLSEARSASVEALYEGHFRAALDAGVFGAPSYVLDGEVFWGQDRLDLLDEALATGRAPFRPV